MQARDVDYRCGETGLRLSGRHDMNETEWDVAVKCFGHCPSGGIE